MASLHYNPHVPGELARVILRRYGDKQFYAKPPLPSTRPPSASMLATRRVFTEAAAYSTAILHNEGRRAPYVAEAAARKMPVFATIMTDFLTKPVIRDVDTSGFHGHAGDPIVVHPRTTGLTIDKVLVALRRADDTPVEDGEAAKDGEAYRFVVSQDVPAGAALFADVTVRDTDGLEVKRSVPLVVG